MCGTLRITVVNYTVLTYLENVSDTHQKTWQIQLENDYYFGQILCNISRLYGPYNMQFGPIAILK